MSACSISYQRHAALSDELRELDLQLPVEISTVEDQEKLIVLAYLSNRIRELEVELSHIER